MINDTYLRTIIDKATVARLATVDSECKPHLIPVVFVFDNDFPSGSDSGSYKLSSLPPFRPRDRVMSEELGYLPVSL